ncbi:MAG: hypothetical protein RLZZ196_3344 [Bacteroidota bacterium]|jgi:hypothetical protein
MRYVTYLVFLSTLLLSSAVHSQCFDVFGRTADCPTENDSLIVYSNALKVYEFYEKNSDYVKLKSVRLRTRQDVMNCFYQLEDAVDSFKTRWQLRERVLKGEDIPSVLLPRDGKNIPIENYYLYIDAYRFYQRELENGILNLSSPIPVYDIRIAPLVINSYENRHSNDGYNGDFVNVALYIPVTVKPYRLLTDSEKVVREKILAGRVPPSMKKETPKKQIPSPPIKKISKVDTTLLPTANIVLVLPEVKKKTTGGKIPWDAQPMYYNNPYGGGWLMGWMIGRKFRKFLPTDEFYEYLPKYLKEFLDDDKKLEQYLRLKWGGYYDGLYNE